MSEQWPSDEQDYPDYWKDRALTAENAAKLSDSHLDDAIAEIRGLKKREAILREAVQEIVTGSNDEGEMFFIAEAALAKAAKI